MRIDSSGNVGIAGQTNPTYKLDGGFADQTWGWYLNSSYNAGFTYNTTERSLLISTKSAENIDHIKFATGGAATERMRIDASGRVGIGTSSVVSALDVLNGGNTYTSGLVLRNGSSTSEATSLYHDNTGSTTTVLANRYGSDSAAIKLVLQDASASPVTALTALGNGRVGIGTSSIDSNAKLQIEDSTNPNINIDRTSSLLTGNHLGYINFQNNGAVTAIWGRG